MEKKYISVTNSLPDLFTQTQKANDKDFLFCYKHFLIKDLSYPFDFPLLIEFLILLICTWNDKKIVLPHSAIVKYTLETM